MTDPTEPRRVPTEVERTARHVHLGPLATVIARLGVALEESRREVQRLHADNDRLRQQIKGGYTPETDRIAIATALIRSGVYDDDETDLLQWHPCATCPRAGGRCGCAGVPYVSDGVWKELGPVIAAIRAPAEEPA